MAVPTFKLVSRNIASSKRLERIIDIVKSEKPDLLLLQEVTLTTAQLQAAVLPLQFNCESNIDQDNPSAPGTAVIWKKNLPVNQVTCLVTCQLQVIGIGQQTFYNVYAPSGSENRRDRALLFSHNMFPHLLQHQGGLLPIMAGDWNCLTAIQDTTRNFKEKYCKELDSLVKSLKYSDAFRILHPNQVEFTFHRASCAPSRLDRVYLPPQVADKVLSVTHRPGLGDHWGVEVVLELEVTRLELPARPPRTHWKLNSSILEHESFLPQFTTIFWRLEEEIEVFDDEADWWDNFAKPACTNFLKSFSVSLAKQRRVYKAFLLALLRVATKKENWEVVSQTKEKLESAVKQEAFGLIVRSRDNQNAEEELASLYHFNKARKGNLEKLRVQQGGIGGYRYGAPTEVTTDQERIKNETESFYDALLNGRQDQHLQDTGQVFEPDYQHLEEFLATLSQLTEASQDFLVERLTPDEVKEALKDCTNGKSPGLDGLTYEFFKKTWSVIGSTFTKVLQSQLDRERIMESSRNGATRLISKVEAVPDVTQLRPITLLQVDYRLLSKCLARRLHMVIAEVVDKGQLGTGGANILTGVYDILSSIDFVNLHKLKAYLASWDAMKAYDRASTNYLDKVTQKMAFPPLFRAWMKMLHFRATTRLILPSGLSREIRVSFSFRQGDCIAGDLYCLTQEPFLRMIRKRLSGLVVSNFTQKDEDYMDDIQFLSSSEGDLVVFNQTAQQFEAQSGFMLSRNLKSKVMGLGQWLEKTDWPLEWIKVVKEVKVLGFMVCPKYQDTLEQSWKMVLRGFERTLFAWKSRSHTTLQQRVTVLEKFALSKLWYVAQVLPLPYAVVKKIESKMSSFIFQGRHERLKLADLENSLERGGLNLTCVATKAECLLLRQSLRILARPEETCSRHLGFWLGSKLEEHFPHLAQLGPSAPVLLPQFPLHRAMLEGLQEGLVRQEFAPDKLDYVTTKKIYQSRAEDIFLPPKVEGKYPDVDFKNTVYPRLKFRILEPEARDVLYCIVHGLVPNKSRLFQQGRAVDPCCPLPECQGQVQDLQHIFCSCWLVAGAWAWLRSKLLQLLPTTEEGIAQATTNSDFISLQFPVDVMDQECTWLLGNYCSLVVNTVTGRRRKMGAEVLAGRMRGRLQRLRGRAVVQPQLYNI